VERPVERRRRWPRVRALGVASALALALALVSTTDARADDGAPLAAPRYEGREPEAYHLRAAAEEVALFVLGSVQYATEQSNSRDWDLHYDWPSFRSKLTGESVRFDTNKFDTNMVTHPVAGTLYYVAARGNRLTILESFLYATAASTVWEYVGEFRELVSINDVIVTPLSGVVVGETLTQLGNYVRRSRPGIARDVVGAILAPSSSAHDALDGATLRASEDVDGLGLARDAGHSFALSGGGGMLFARNAGASAMERASLHGELVDVGRYHGIGPVSGWMTDGGVTRLDAEASANRDGWSDFELDAAIAPFGYYHQDLRRSGVALAGHRLFIGTGVGFDYGAHRYVSTGRDGAVDHVAGVHAAGLWLSAAGYSGALRARVDLETHPEFAAVRSLALDDYTAQRRDVVALPSVAATQGYYYALGAVVAPSVEIDVGPMAFGASARLEAFRGIEGLDRHQDELRGEVELTDQRVLARAWVGGSPIDALHLRITAEQRLRRGQIAGVSTSVEETALVASAGVVF
jgi:hypothetical protein